MIIYGAYTFSLLVFALVECTFYFSFLWIWKGTGNKIFSSKITYAVLFLTIQNYFLIFLEHLNITFETTLSWTLVAAWRFYVDYQTTQTGSRSNVTSKMELFVTIFDSFHFLTIVMKISILDVAGVIHPTHSLHRAESYSSWSQFYLFIGINSNSKGDG